MHKRQVGKPRVNFPDQLGHHLTSQGLGRLYSRPKFKF